MLTPDDLTPAERDSIIEAARITLKAIIDNDQA